MYVNVSEAPRTITKLEAKSFSVASGTSKQELYAQMPKQVVATYSDGSTDLLDIDVWDLSNVTDELLNGTGTVEITGTVKLNGAKVTCNVTVVDQKAQTPDYVEPIDVVEIVDNAKVSDLMDKLPSKVTVVMKDGKTKKETPVKWSQVDSLGRAGTEFEVTGLTDNGMTVKAQVKVTAHIVDIDVAEDIVVVRGTKADDVLAKLPSTVTAIYSDDTESDVEVKWDTKGFSDKDFAKEGEVTVKGKVAGTDQKAECTITVVKSDAEIPASVEPVAGVSVPEGASADAVRDALKGVKATVRMKDGKTTAESEITWTEVPDAAAAYGNSVVAKGVTVNGNLPVEVVVTSTTTINKVAEVPQITVERDAKADAVTGQLPKKVAVMYSDGHTDEATVTWNTDGLDKQLAAVGEYTLEGSVEGTTLKATCKLVVETPASEIPVRPATFAPVEVFEASSAADVLKALPKKVSVMMKDDSQEDYDVDWENVPALDWGADDVTVDGKVRGADLTVSCMVRVTPRPAAKGLVIVDQNGKATTSETVLKVERGKEIDLAAAASNAADGALLRGNVTWTSSDPTIATVENGKVKALKNGTVVVTATMPVDGDAAAIATLAEDGAAETPAPQQLTASVTVEVVEPVVVQEPTGGKDNGAKPDAKDPSGKKNGKKAAKGSLAETGDNTAVTVAALGGTGLLALIAAAIEKLRHRTE